MEPTAFYLIYPSNNDFTIDRYKLYDCGSEITPRLAGFYPLTLNRRISKLATEQIRER